ncbi:MAG: SDR family oxidoreductase [Gammaproteobacteria bacterium]
MTDVAGKRVLITGGASGIGRQLADELASRGAHISLWDIDAAGLEKAAAELKQFNVKVHTLQCDLSSKDDIKAGATSMREDDLHVDVLINNAGIVSGGYLLDISDQQIERTFAVNTLALFWMTREFLPDMIHAGGGHIVTVASAGGFTGTAKQVDYSSSKFAAFGFDEALRVELHKMGTPVTTTVVCPFYVDTGMFAGVKTRFSWLLPILPQDYVVNKTVNAIVENKRRLIMPRMVYSIFLMRLLPVRVMDGLMRFFGISQTMDEFTGRASR